MDKKYTEFLPFFMAFIALMMLALIAGSLERVNNNLNKILEPQNYASEISYQSQVVERPPKYALHPDEYVKWGYVPSKFW